MYGLTAVRALAAAVTLASWIPCQLLETHDDDGSAHRCQNANGHAAIDACTTLLRGSEPNVTDSGLIYFLRANAYESIGEYEKAVADDNAALAQGGTGRSGAVRFTADVLNNRGIAFARLGQLEKALSDFSQVIALKPDDTSAYVNRASVFLTESQPQRAIADYDSAIKLHPNGQAYFLRGLAHAQSGELEKAIDDYSRTIERGSDFVAPALGERCGARAALDSELDKALEDCNASLKLEPKSAGILFSRGFANFRMGKDDAAVADLTASLALSAASGSTLYIRGLARLHQGDAGGQADIAWARLLDPKVGLIFVKLGIPDQPTLKPSR